VRLSSCSRADTVADELVERARIRHQVAGRSPKSEAVRKSREEHRNLLDRYIAPYFGPQMLESLEVQYQLTLS